MSARIRLAAIALVLPLAGCGIGDVFGEDGEPRYCPRIVPVVEAQEMTRFDGAGRDLTDVVFEARLADVTAACDTELDEIDLEMQVTVAARRGPANTTGTADFAYFVAVATTEERILARDEYAVSVPFEGNRTNVGLIDEVDVVIPLAEGQNGREHVIYVGLALNQPELQWNRENR